MIISPRAPLALPPQLPREFHEFTLQEAHEQRKAKMARYTPASAPYEELQAARAQRLEVRS